jgi:hypothetical protein
MKAYCSKGNCAASQDGEKIDVYADTADLIAELEKRRPCDKCQDRVRGDCRCLWNDPFYGYNNNFKEAK